MDSLNLDSESGFISLNLAIDRYMFGKKSTIPARRHSQGPSILKKVNHVPGKVVRTLSQPSLASAPASILPQPSTSASTLLSVQTSPQPSTSGQTFAMASPSAPTVLSSAQTSTGSAFVQASSYGFKSTRPLPSLISLMPRVYSSVNNQMPTTLRPVRQSLASQLILNRLNDDGPDSTILHEQNNDSANTTISLNFNSFSLLYSDSSDNDN